MTFKNFRVLACLAALAAASELQAKPAYKKALAEYFGPYLSTKLNDCRTCHLPTSPGKTEATLADEKPHNPFGARLKAIKKELHKAGKKTDIMARVEAIAQEDADRDGVANIIEILTGHNPGESDDRPNAAEVSEGQRKRLAFQKYRVASSWNPFEPVKRPALPSVNHASWARNPIDAFIAAEHESHRLRPRPEANRNILLRRVYLDLIGFPPTREELHAFLQDRTPDAYEKVVDQLLASPHYGERWGRHWMDVWRYSDWAGFGAEVRDSQRHIWHWRDWIVEALNDNKPYDRMIQEMLAGDELAPTDPNVFRATGFLVRNWYIFNRNTWLENAVEHTGKAFLGVTLNCARCHDHFFDPISQKEYYQFRAFFEPHDIRTDSVPGQPDLLKAGIPRIFDARIDAKTYLFVRGNEKNPDESEALSPAVPVALGGPELQVRPIDLPLTSYCPDKRGFVESEAIEASRQEIARARASLAAARKGIPAAVVSIVFDKPSVFLFRIPVLFQSIQTFHLAETDLGLAQVKHASLVATLRAERLEDEGKKDSAEGKAAAREAGTLQATLSLATARRVLLVARQAWENSNIAKKSALAKKMAEAEKVVTQAEAQIKQQSAPVFARRTLRTYPAKSSGRRLALARWITARSNPLTARVAMNQLWLRHFGKPIVPTVFDFGRNGQPPTHPALLDWLAAEFMNPTVRSGVVRSTGWDMKAMHRLMVTSSTYRMDSSGDKVDAALDPDNRYLWRIPARRMEAELVRDGVLYLSGQMDLTMGGPELDHSLGLTSTRRSLYFQHAAEKQMEFLALFDAANVSECYRRTESILPQQALAMVNSSMVIAQARVLARRLGKEFPPHRDGQEAFVKAGFEQVLGRLPTSRELTECVRFLNSQSKLLVDAKKLTSFPGPFSAPVAPAADADLRAREDLIQVLMNHNEFVTIR